MGSEGKNDDYFLLQMFYQDEENFWEVKIFIFASTSCQVKTLHKHETVQIPQPDQKVLKSSVLF